MPSPNEPFDFTHLEPDQRVLLAHDLLAGVHGSSTAQELTESQKAELLARIEEADAGTAQFASAAEVMAELFAEFRSRQ